MTAKVELIIGLEKIAEAGDEFGVIFAFESCARGYVKNAISAAILVLGIGTPSMSQLTWWPPRTWS